TPASGRRRIRLGDCEVPTVIAVQTPPDRVEVAFEDADGKVIARRREWGERRPPVRGRVVGFMSPRVATVGADAPDRVELPGEHGDREGAPWRRQPRPLVPPVARGVVGEDSIHGAPPATVTTDNVQDAADRCCTGMVEAGGERRTLLPPVAL